MWMFLYFSGNLIKIQNKIDVIKYDLDGVEEKRHIHLQLNWKMKKKMRLYMSVVIIKWGRRKHIREFKMNGKTKKKRSKDAETGGRHRDRLRKEELEFNKITSQKRKTFLWMLKTFRAHTHKQRHARSHNRMQFYMRNKIRIYSIQWKAVKSSMVERRCHRKTPRARDTMWWNYGIE